MWNAKLKFKNFLFNHHHLKKVSRNIGQQVEDRSFSALILTFLFKLLVLGLGTLLVLFPFFYMISGSLMSFDEIANQPSDVIKIVPSKPIWSNFVKAMAEGYWKAVLFTAGITLFSIVAKLLITMLMGYAFSLPKWRAKKFLWLFLLSLMMLPEVALLAGQFKIVTQLSIRTGSLLLITLSLPFIASVFNALLFRTAFESIPTRTKEAAMVDGCSPIKYFVKIAVPMVTPTIWTVAIITSFAAWNSYMWPSLLISGTGSNLEVMSTWLFTTGLPTNPDDSRLMTEIRLAAAILAILPMFIAYFLMRRRMMRSISRQGSVIKG